MKSKKLPIRKCVGCGESKPKKELIRVVKSNEGQINVDLTGKINGRGLYICSNLECFEKARKGKKLNKGLKSYVDDEIYDKLIMEIEKHE